MAIMLDLETLSTRSNAYILSIGAVEFDVKTGKLGKIFYKPVNCDGWASRFHIDAATVRWWLTQTEEARRLVATQIAPNLPETLVLFEAFIRECGGHQCEVWGNGADFDNVILRSAYLAFEKDAPWSYTASRCYRTLRNLYNPASPEAPATADQITSWGGILPADLPPSIFTAHSALGGDEVFAVLSAHPAVF
jgi:hypothetical protein